MMIIVTNLLTFCSVQLIILLVTNEFHDSDLMSAMMVSFL